MAKKGKDFKIPDNLFDKKFWTTFEAVAVNEYRKIIFDVSNPRMSNDKPFPAYSKDYGEYKSSGEPIRRMGGDSSYRGSTAPYVSGDLMNDTNSSVDPKTFSVFIGWNKESYKVDSLRKKGRILTSRSDPYPASAMKKLMPEINRNLKRVMPKGSQTITIKKK